MRSLQVAAMVLLAGWAGANAQAPPAAQEGTPVLTEDGYFRIYHQFGLMRISSDALKAEGESLLGKELQRLASQTRQHLADAKIDWQQTDWRDRAIVHFRRTQLGDDTRAVEMIPTVPPPAGWDMTDFDDSTWLRQRLGRLPVQRYMAEAYEFSSLMARRICLRTHFLVPDAAKAGDLTLSLTFRGGARVLVNGTEVARGHLPEGNLSDDAFARDYPRAAYLTLPEEAPAKRSGICGDIRCPFEQAPEPQENRKEWEGCRMNAARQPVNRQGWQRLMDLRDRRLSAIRIPARLLRSGTNVLAIDVRGARFHPQILPGAGHPQAENWGRHGGTENFTWDHARLLGLELRAGSAGVPSAVKRPPGVQVWAEDMHTRLFSRDFNPAGWPTGSIRIVAAQNGCFSAMLAVGTDRELTGLKGAVGDLKHEGGGPAIPASSIRVGYLNGHSILELHKLGYDRCLGMYNWDCPMAVLAVSRYGVHLAGPPKDERARQEAWQRMMSAFEFFDHIASDPPDKVPADTCQPLWVSVQVPADARPGKYRGTVSVQADGIAPITVPIELEVIGWRIPSPREFQTIVESEQSPYAVYNAYKARKPAPAAAPASQPAAEALKLWSPEHWRLIEESFRQLGRLGADWVFVPVLINSEFGNREDCSMIRWIRGRDGELRFDYQVLDRYLDLAIKHCGPPRVVCFQIMHGVGSSTSQVKVLDEATGKESPVDVGPGAQETRRPLWRAFATGLRAHMRRRGLEGAMFWGHAFDRVYDPGLVDLMEELAPGIHWAAGAHARQPDATFRAVARSYGSDITDRSFKGWKNPFIHLVMPRTNGSVICVEGTSTPFTYRVLPDRAIYCGFNGIGRMGADYFDLTWFDGFHGGEYLLVGRSCVQTLWPGPRGAESSARNEAMLEGVQEAEARIFLEQALDRGLLPEDMARAAQRVLDDHFRATLHIPGGTAALTMMDYAGDWQGRSRRLYSMAAAVAEYVGVDTDTAQIGGEKVQSAFEGQARAVQARQGVPLPARGKTQVQVRLRNWTGSPRAWKAATTQPWIAPVRTQGTLAGQEELAVALDGKDFTPGQTVTGSLAITDVASGRSCQVRIAAEVVKPVELIVRKTVFNVPVGDQEQQDYLLLNRTDAPQAWRLEASAPWLKVEPGSGTLPARGTTFVMVTAGPKDAGAAVHDATLTLSAMEGAVAKKMSFKAFVIPPYRAPAGPPAGVPVPLETVSKALLVRHRSLDWFRDDRHHTAPTFGKTLNVWHGQQPLRIGQKAYDSGLWVLPAHETVYNIEGKGYAAFSAEVGWNSMVAANPGLGSGHNTFRLTFEVYADGKCVAHSGLVKSTDPPRLLVAEGLAGAKELKLITRTDYLGDNSIAYSNWANPTLYKAR